MSKRKWRWVTRDFGMSKIVVHSCEAKPDLYADGSYLSSEGPVLCVCIAEFETATGITINPGECVKVEFSAKVIE